MNLRSISIALLILCFFITFSACSNIEADISGDFSVNCGSTGASADINGRQWLGDERLKLSPSLQLGGKSTASTAVRKSTAADPVPYRTARISGSQFFYSFQLIPGQKIIRLHFNPTLYGGFKGFRDFFTVEAGNFILLANFSASLTADALGVITLVKEYCLNIEENQPLVITFSPESNPWIDTYAFVNGIEIVSVPPSRSYFDGGKIGLKIVGEKSMVFFDDRTALEIVHRVNIKPDLVPETGYFDRVFPNGVKNKTWKLPVEVGFRYLIRLHLSVVGLKIAGAGDLMFKILINDVIAYTNTDAVLGRDQDNTGLYKDYMVVMRGRRQSGRRDILIALRSVYELADGYGVLAGFEILKLSNPDDNLAGPNPLPPLQDSQSHIFQYLIAFLNHPNVKETVAITVLSLLCIVVHKLREVWEACSTDEEHKPSANAEKHCRRFSLAEIESATRSFNEGLVIGRGGFGKVYKGLIDKGQNTVAIKRLKSNSKQGVREFLTEIETLSKVRHMNLVPLIGYCREHREMILVYEYMAGGTLADHLYKPGTDISPLNWKQCLNICIGAARGLEYLHTGNGIIHRDVKASNILLDESFMAKVSDFGLAKTEDRSKLLSHVSTLVKGTRGYLDAHYIKTGKLTRKSDVYAFGVVLLEVLCGRKALDLELLEEERLLSSWALDKISKGEVDEIVASNLRGEISPNSLKSFVEVAERCLHDDPKHRPTMSQIVTQLEFALELQESNGGFVSSEAAKIDGVDQSSTLQQPISSAELQTTAFTSNQHLQPRRNKLWMVWSWDALWNQVKPTKNVSKQVRERLDIKCRCFSLHEIKKATDGFNHWFLMNDDSYMGIRVYKGFIDNGATTVAIKRMNPSSNEENNNFITEIQMHSELRHLNLVSLIGYHSGKRERILVYEYMMRGNLRRHLYNSETSPLTWKQRLQICLGAAKGLDYLHTGTDRIIIHRDVKPTHILLDENWVPKMHNLGLSRAIYDDSGTHATTLVQGTSGYLDPEYFHTSQLTVKSDVYSFGIVLLEVLCGRPPIISEACNLVHWFHFCYINGEVDKVVDVNLKGQIAPQCLTEFAETARACLCRKGSERPAMKDVIRRLESAIQLQEYTGTEEEEPNDSIVGGEKEEDKAMEGVASIALLPNGSISGHFIQLPNSVCYGLHGIELECERECSHGEDYRLIKLTVTDYKRNRERDVVVECKGHDAAKICTPEHAHGWQKDVVGMVEEKHGKRKISVHFECEILKADEAAEDDLRKFMPKLVGMDAVVNIGRMTVTGFDFEGYEHNDIVSPNDAASAGS